MHIEEYVEDRNMGHFTPHQPVWVEKAHGSEEEGYHDAFICGSCGAHKQQYDEDEQHRMARRLLNAREGEEFGFRFADGTVADGEVAGVSDEVAAHDLEVGFEDPEEEFANFVVYVDNVERRDGAGSRVTSAHVWGCTLKMPTEEDPIDDHGEVQEMLDWNQEIDPTNIDHERFRG